jgi:predicted phosphodiesterase
MADMKMRLKAELLRVKAKLGKPSISARDWDEHSKISRRQLLKLYPEGWESFLILNGIHPGNAGGKAIPPEVKLLREQLRDKQRELDEEKNRSKVLRVLGSMEPSPPPAWLVKGSRNQAITGIPLLFLSDIHFDEVVRKEEINYPNSYNRAIAVRRLQNTFESTVKLLKFYMRDPQYDGIVCALGGDMVSGNIHKELRESNEEKILKTCLDLSTYLGAGIRLLADEFGKVFVPCVTGNHGRLNEKYHFKARARDNFDWLIYKLLEKEFQSDKRVTIQAPETPDILFAINGKRFLLTHGDQFHGGSGISGVFAPLMLGQHRKQKKQAAYNQPFDVLMMGHWHQYIHTESLLVNGSVKGYDEYADQHNFPPEPAQQSLSIIRPDGQITYRMPVLCDGGKPAASMEEKKKLIVW